VTVPKNIPLTFDQAKAELTDIINEVGPDTVYYSPGDDGCVYFYGGQPSCIVGHLLAKHGVTQEDLDEAGCNAETGALSFFEVDFFDEPIFAPDPAVKVLLSTVQKQQDRLVPWRQALDGAIEDALEAQQRTR
jgi:hypothetical protein